ncbi:MAG: RPA12/RPB9/RPC11 RNA polymerase family protein [Promethearchaeia archaeon]
MLPSKRDGKVILKCKCGASRRLAEEKKKDYQIKKEVKHSLTEEVVSMKQFLDWKNKNLSSTIKDFKCPRCGYKKAHLETKQTRSADEGMTHFITCLKCGKMIKIGS